MLVYQRVTLLYHDPNNHGKTIGKPMEKPMDPMGHCHWATTRQVSPPSAQLTVQRPATSEDTTEPSDFAMENQGLLPIFRDVTGISRGFHAEIRKMTINMDLTIRKGDELPVGQSQKRHWKWMKPGVPNRRDLLICHFGPTKFPISFVRLSH